MIEHCKIGVSVVSFQRYFGEQGKKLSRMREMKGEQAFIPYKKEVPEAGMYHTTPQ
jgi:hypothetical protein